jgi:uncharacterized membrane protein YgaE (UPF0421/DUF939 family)
MKKSDIAMVVLIASISVVLAFFVSQSLLGDDYAESAQVDTIEKIVPTIVEPSKNIFNPDAINPTVPVQIGETQ